MENKERSSILYAMDVFDLLKQDKMTPEVKKLIGYAHNEIRASALGSLIEESEIGIGPQFEDTYDEEVLLKEIPEVMSLDVYQEVMGAYVQKVLDSGEKGDSTEKMEVARAIGFMDSGSPLAANLDELLRDSSPDVSKYAMESAARLKQREHVPALVEKLKNPITRDDAKLALAKFGSGIVGTLSDYMDDKSEDIELRRSVVDVLARISNQDAVDCLLWELTQNMSQMSKDIIDALDLIRSKKPDIQFEEKAVKRKLFTRIRAYYSELIAFSETKTRDEMKDIKLSGLPDRFSQLTSEIFKLLGLIYPHEDIVKAEQNIRAGTKEATAYAIEMLDNILKKEVKDVIFPLIENLTLSERAERCRILLMSYPALKVTNGEKYGL
jgi:AAA family ATP:ADP antiporter